MQTFRFYPNDHYYENVRQYVMSHLSVADILKNDWYSVAYDFCHGLAVKHNLAGDQVAAICATLSAGANWQVNKRATIACLNGAPKYGRFPHTQVAKCSSILESGVQIGVNLRGQKVERFYHNIMGNSSVVTIDRHMVRVCRNDFDCTDENKLKVGKRGYRAMADAVLRLAAELSVNPDSLQAAIWVKLRGTPE